MSSSRWTFKGARLDRALCNTEWSLQFPHAKVTILPKLHSNHSPVHVLIYGDENIPQQHRFWFQAVWLTHPGFKKLIKDTWNNNVSLSENNRNLATRLVQWNKDCFGNILSRKRRLWARLAGIQKIITTHRSYETGK